MEGVPRGLDVTAIEATILGVDGVTDVHDLHVWAVSSGSNVMTSHVVVRDSADGDAVLAAVVDAVSDAFEIHQCTIKIERAAFHESVPSPSH